MPRQSYARLEGAADVSRAFKNLDTNVKRAVKEITRDSLNEVKRGTQARIPTGPGKLGQHTRDTFKVEYAPDRLSGQVRSSWFIARLREFGHNIARGGKIIGVRGKQTVKTPTGNKVVADRNTTVVGRVRGRPALFAAFAVVRRNYLRRLEAAIYGITRGGLR